MIKYRIVIMEELNYYIEIYSIIHSMDVYYASKGGGRAGKLLAKVVDMFFAGFGAWFTTVPQILVLFISCKSHKSLCVLWTPFLQTMFPFNSPFTTYQSGGSHHVDIPQRT